MNLTDRYYIERKYHNPEEEFNPFARMSYHGEGYIEESGLDDNEILKGLEKIHQSSQALPHPIAKAKAIEYVLKNERIYINEHDYFVGLYSLNRLASSYTSALWEKASIEQRESSLVKVAENFNNSGAVMIWTDYDHVVPDWESLITLGFNGIRERARAYKNQHIANKTLNEEKSAFFEAIEIQYTAIINLIDRMYKSALNQSFKKAPIIAECLKNLRDGRPTTFYEGLQLIYIYFLISESVDSYQVRSLGNGLDNTLYRLYKSDIESGRYTENDIREYLSYFLMQWSAIGNYWGQPFYMGGTDKNGKTKYNELSYLILDVYDRLEIYNPKIQLKINGNTPDKLLNKAFDMVRRKNASIVFCCEPAMIRAIMGYGATFDEALNYDIRGCYETGVRANEVSSSSGYVNAAKAVELVFTNGYDTVTETQIGIRTGCISEFNCFEDFYYAFLRQWKYLIKKSMEITNDAERFLSYVNPSTMYSATIEESLKNGKDGYGGGVKFNNNAMLNCGFASAVDSILAVKEFVYDKEEITLKALSNALKNNWENEEKLRLKIKKSRHKYGNGDFIADTYAKAMADFFAQCVNNTPNGRGGVYKAVLHSARAFIEQGTKTGALPCGRFKGEELSKNASPAVGSDKNGITALISSAIALSPHQYHESFCLDVMLHPSSVQGEDGLTALKGILSVYLKNGGQSIQFNIFNSEQLREAQLEPEKYKNFQVRVCGWNTLWSNMSKAEQDAYILKAENVK